MDGGTSETQRWLGGRAITELPTGILSGRRSSLVTWKGQKLLSYPPPGNSEPGKGYILENKPCPGTQRFDQRDSRVCHDGDQETCALVVVKLLQSRSRSLCVCCLKMDHLDWLSSSDGLLKDNLHNSIRKHRVE